MYLHNLFKNDKNYFDEEIYIIDAFCLPFAGGLGEKSGSLDFDYYEF